MTITSDRLQQVIDDVKGVEGALAILIAHTSGGQRVLESLRLASQLLTALPGKGVKVTE